MQFVDPFLQQTVVLGIVIVLAIFVGPIVLSAQVRVNLVQPVCPPQVRSLSLGQ